MVWPSHGLPAVNAKYSLFCSPPEASQKSGEEWVRCEERRRLPVLCRHTVEPVFAGGCPAERPTPTEAAYEQAGHQARRELAPRLPQTRYFLPPLTWSSRRLFGRRGLAHLHMNVSPSLLFPISSNAILSSPLLERRPRLSRSIAFRTFSYPRGTHPRLLLAAHCQVGHLACTPFPLTSHFSA